MVTLVTIPLTWGHFFRIGVLRSVGFGYFKLGFLKRRRRNAACLQVANYTIKNCHEIPSQYIKNGIPVNNVNSLSEISRGSDFNNKFENPNMAFIQERKKKEGPNKYKNKSKKTDANGNKSRKKEKNKNSETKKIEPGNPKKISIFRSTTKKSLGVK